MVIVMSEAMVKGDLILKVLEHVSNKRGKDSLVKIGVDPSGYLIEKWYPISDFLSLISKIDDAYGDGDGSKAIASRIGYEIMKFDFRWQMLFRGKDPKDVFTSTKRQDGQYRGGRFEASATEDKKVTIILREWPNDMVWYEFYKGRLQAVLELTGNTGIVDITCIELDDEPTCTYDIIWE